MSGFELQRPGIDPVVSHRDKSSSARPSNRAYCLFWIRLFRRYVQHAVRTPTASFTLMRYPRHECGECGFRTCMFVVAQEQPVYVCTHTGAVHLCSPSCDRMEYLQHYNVKRCGISGREFPADFEDDDAHNRATRRTLADDGDQTNLYAAATVRTWQRQESNSLFHAQCVRAERERSAFPTLPTRHDHDTQTSTSSSKSATTTTSLRSTTSSERRTIRRKSMPRVAKASLVHKPETRKYVSSIWRSVLLSFFPNRALQTAIRTAYFEAVECNVASRHDIALLQQEKALNKHITSAIDAHHPERVFDWVFRYLWYTWMAIVDTPRYRKNQFSYQPDNHAVAIVRYLAIGYQHHGRQVVPRVHWLGEMAVDIKVRSHESGHDKAHTSRRNLTRSTAMFMQLWSQVSDTRNDQLPPIQQDLNPFF